MGIELINTQQLNLSGTRELHRYNYRMRAGEFQELCDFNLA
jgi:hypothetical protein